MWTLIALLSLGVGGVGQLAHALLEHAPETAHACCGEDQAPQPSGEHDDGEDPLSPHGEEDCPICHLAFSSAKIVADGGASGLLIETEAPAWALPERREAAPWRGLKGRPTRGPPTG